MSPTHGVILEAGRTGSEACAGGGARAPGAHRDGREARGRREKAVAGSCTWFGSGLASRAAAVKSPRVLSRCIMMGDRGLAPCGRIGRRGGADRPLAPRPPWPPGAAAARPWLGSPGCGHAGRRRPAGAAAPVRRREWGERGSSGAWTRAERWRERTEPRACREGRRAALGAAVHPAGLAPARRRSRPSSRSRQGRVAQRTFSQG